MTRRELRDTIAGAASIAMLAEAIAIGLFILNLIAWAAILGGPQ